MYKTVRLLLVFASASTLVACTGVNKMSASSGVDAGMDEPLLESGNSWDSLKSYASAPEWFADAKFGIYAHWGPYALPIPPGEYGDWYSRNMYIENHPVRKFHEAKYGPIEDFGYKDLVPLFTTEKFDASEWASLYAKAGARFGGPVALHSDGYAFWDSPSTRWDTVDIGPNRDIVGEMEAAIRANGMKFVTSFHHSWKWGWYPTWDETLDTSDPEYADLYGPPATGQDAWGVLNEGGGRNPLALDLVELPPESFVQEWRTKIDEVVEGYQPDMIWFDNRMTVLPEQARIDMAANFYKRAAARGQDVVLTYKTPDMEPGTATVDLERNRKAEIHPVPWLTDSSIARNSWSLADPMEYYSARRIIHDLADIVSKNGNLFLNIAPHPDGTIPQEQEDILIAIGAWLDENGEAIYGTRAWDVFGEGPTVTPTGHLSDLKFEGFSSGDIRYTQSKDGNTLYAIKFGGSDTSVTLRSLRNISVDSVSLLETGDVVNWSQSVAGLTVPAHGDAKNDMPFVYKIVLEAQ